MGNMIRSLALFTMVTFQAYGAIQVELTPSVPSPRPVGAKVLWIAVASDLNPGELDFRFACVPSASHFGWSGTSIAARFLSGVPTSARVTLTSK